MALKIYESVTPSSYFSIDGTFTNPLSNSFDGISGGMIEKCYYVRNNDLLHWYSSITVQPIDGGDLIVDGAGLTEGFSWKLIAGDSQPLEEQWELVTAGTSISLSNIGSASTGDISTYLPFWLRITVPAKVSINTFQKAILKIAATENLVT